MTVKQKQKGSFHNLIGRSLKPFSKNLGAHPTYNTDRLNEKLKCERKHQVLQIVKRKLN